MRSRSFFSYAVFSIGFITLGAPGGQAAPGYRVSGPFTHDNLSLYFVHGEADKGPVPLTLEEALARGKVQVDETSRVNELSLENLGDEEVFIQAGDIVKGGKQDRVIGVSLLVPSKVGQDPDLVFLRRAGPMDGARQRRPKPLCERGKLRSLAQSEDGDLRGSVSGTGRRVRRRSSQLRRRAGQHIVASGGGVAGRRRYATQVAE